MRPGLSGSLTSYEDSETSLLPRLSQTSSAALQLRFAQNDKESCPSFLHVTNRIFKSGFTKTFEPQETGIAFAAGETFGRRIVTTVGERKIDAELDGFADDIGFRKFD